MANQ
jgi:hypothetical protein